MASDKSKSPTPAATKSKQRTRLVTTAQAAELLSVSQRTVLNWIKSGAVPYVELPHQGQRHEYRIPVDELLETLGGSYDLSALADEIAVSE